MKHQNPSELELAAEAVPFGGGNGTMSHSERLDRWVTLLDRHRGPVNALREIEYLPLAERRLLRGENTPLTIAFQDPILRGAGLSGDRLGDAMDFFDISEDDAHHLFCDCHYHGTMTGAGLASRMRHHLDRANRPSLWSRVRDFVLGHRL